MRKSTEQAERQSLSIPAQKRKIEELFPDINIVKWLDESMSAFKPGRPGFDEMMRMLHEGEADAIVSWHPDRISRNEVDAAQITYGMRQGIIKDLKFGSYFFDNSPEGIMMLQSVMSHSQYSSAKLSKDVKRGNDEQRKRGWLTGRAIEGYINERNADGMSFGIIVKDPERFDLRRKMWDFMLTGDYSVPQVMEIANKQWGYTTRGDKRYPKGPISRSALYYMLTNPRYAGLIPKPDEPDTFEEASYPAMVTIEEFDRVQEILGSKGTRKLAARKVFRYKGLLICGECSCSITAEETTRYYKNGKTQTFTYYHCTHKRPCANRRNLNETKLEKQFDSELSMRTILPQFKEWALETLDDQNDIEATDINAVLKSQNQAIESKHKEMKKLIKMAAKELIDEGQFRLEKKDIETEIKTLGKELNDTNKRADSWYDTFTRTFELALHGRERFMNGDSKVKREILSNLGSNPVLLDGKLVITPHPWLAPIEKMYPELEVRYQKVITSDYPSIKAKTDALASIHSTWLGR